MAFELSSPAFSSGDAIPPRYARRGGNVSPPLEWRDAPPGAKSFMLVVEDPDAPAGLFRHWAVYNIPAARDRLPEGAESERLDTVVNSFSNEGYDGPDPPKGDAPHHYYFRLAALDIERLDPGPDADADDLWEAAEGHVLAETDLIGRYVS